jgi:hypothetical protein
MPDDPALLVFACSRMEDVTPTYNRLLSALPPGDRPEFTAAFKRFLVAFSWEEMHERVNGLSITQLIEQSRRLSEPDVVATGEQEGMGFTLYEKPDVGKRA